jgi:hypothetical protein
VAACALVPATAFADSAVSALSLGTATGPADCTNNASVTWSFTYTVPPTTDFFSITTPTGPIGGFQQPSTAGSSGSYTGPFNAPIAIPQTPNTLIGTYGSVGDYPQTVNTAEFFILYNCTTQQVLYSCRGNSGRCPRTAAQALAIISAPIPVDTPALVAAALVLLGGFGAYAARRRVRA